MSNTDSNTVLVPNNPTSSDTRIARVKSSLPGWSPPSSHGRTSASIPTVPDASFSGKEDEPAGVDSVKITPEPGTALCRATAFAVRKCVRVYAVIGWPS